MIPSSNDGPKVYFQGLDEIRAIAALSVVLHHIELYKYREGIASLLHTPLAPVIATLGEHGVYTFFVLSGFLITYLLLVEKERFSVINFRKFYIRRILRIWPLYYLVIFLGFFVVPLVAPRVGFLRNESYYFDKVIKLQESFVVTLGLFLLFLPNLALKLKSPVVGASQTWSIGVEEQFYLIWPQVVQRIPGSLMAMAFAIIALGYPCLPSLVEYWSLQLADYLALMIALFPIHIMGIGALGAVILFRHSRSLQSILTSGILFLCTLCALVVVLIIRVHAAVFAGIVMLAIAFCIQENLKVNLRSTVLRKIGKISYGLYMYHSLVMYFVFGVIHSVLKISPSGAVYHIVLYMAVLSLSLAISQLSYTWFELPFITLKNRRFTVIASGPTEPSN